MADCKKQDTVYKSEKMGFDVNRFQGPVDEELICPICSGVLQDPVQVFIIIALFVPNCCQPHIFSVHVTLPIA